MTNMTHQRELERGLLGDYVIHTEVTRDEVRRFRLTPEAFTEPQYQAAFTRLQESPETDDLKIACLLRDCLGGLPQSKDVEDIISHASPTSGHVAARVRELSNNAYKRDILAVMTSLLATSGKLSDPICIRDFVVNAINDIPLPPSMEEIKQNAAPDAAAPNAAEEGEFPESLLNVPGFVNGLTEYTLARAFRPKRVVAFTGALAMLAHLAARLYTDPIGTRPNLYLVLIGETGMGKDRPRSTNKDFARKVQIGGTVCDQFASGQALEDALYMHPALLAQPDEFHTTLCATKEKNNEVGAGLNRALLTFYTESASCHTMRLKVGSGGGNAADMTGRVINEPHLSIFATCTPSGFFKALSLDAVGSGLLGRCLVIEGGATVRQRDDPKGRPFEDFDLKQGGELASHQRGLPFNQPSNPTVVDYAEGALELRKKIKDEAEDLREKARREGDEIGMALWVRVMEKVNKLALLHALSEYHYEPKITVEGLTWARDFAFHCTRRLCRLAATHITTSDVDAHCLAILLQFKKRHKTRLKRSVIAQTTRLNEREMNDAEKTLVDRGDIQVVQISRSSKEYTLVKPLSEIG